MTTNLTRSSQNSMIQLNKRDLIDSVTMIQDGGDPYGKDEEK